MSEAYRRLHKNSRRKDNSKGMEKKKKKIMILGASVYQVPLIRAAKAMGLYTLVASIPGDYPGFALADKVYYINTRDKEGILKACREETVDGICTTGTDVAVSTIGYVCEKLGLSGLSEEAARRATDKAAMKEAFFSEGVSAARFYKARSLEDVTWAAGELGFPVVVKRVDSSGSRGISIVREPAGLKEAFRCALERSDKDYVLVEEMLSGTEIGVDGVVQNHRLVFFAPHEKFVYHSEKITIPAGHGFPYRGSEKVQQRLREEMELAVKALDLNNCSVNADVFVDGDQVWMIEMGGRTGATCIPELISMYYGFDFYKKILQNALGETLDFSPERPGVHCMAKLLMSPVDGKITGVNLKELEELRREGVEIALDYPVGHPVEAMQNGTTRIGHVVARAESVEELDETVARVYGCIEVNGISLEELWGK